MYHKNVYALGEFQACAFIGPYPLEKQSFSLSLSLSFFSPVITVLLFEQAPHDQKSSSSHQCQLRAKEAKARNVTQKTQYIG